MRIIGLALASALGLAACAVTAPPPPPEPKAAPRPDGLMVWPDLLTRERPKESAMIRYGDAALQVVDLWLPAGKGPHPTVLMVHGGCWQSEIADRRIMDWISDDLRRRGIAVWNIDYRGVDREGGGYPGTFLDAGAAADALRTHARTYNLDISPLVAVGHSAGGHLALWLAGRPRLPAASPLRTANPIPIHHVVSLGGLPDLEQARAEKQGCGPEVIDRISGGSLADTSVPRLTPLGVSQTLVNGDSDRIIPTNFAHDYAARMKAAGDRVAVTILPRQGHVELIAPETPAWAAAVKAIEKALGRK
ncbi:MAG TPA: alpha/beta hydrolase [Allosphingosinicella sp.]|nr:alpha/beta hydrolase [Allosphingosinicella sp.]